MFQRIVVGGVSVIALVIAACFMSLTGFGPNLALAEVQERLSKVKSVKFTVTEQSAGHPENKYTIQVLEPDHVRVEHDGEVSINDLTKRRMIQLNPQKRYAVITTEFNPKEGRGIYDEIRTMSTRSVANLPSQIMDGKETIGFLIDRGTSSRREVKLWVDAETKLPVRLESAKTVPQAPGVDPLVVRTVASDFVFDEPLDESLFETDAPTGYTVETHELSRPSTSELEKSKSLALNVGKGIGSATFGMSQVEAIRELGRPDRVNARVGGGTTLDYRSRGFTISIDQTGIMGVTLSEAPENSLYSQTFPGATDKGIRMGATSAEIQREYGFPESGSAAQGFMGYQSLGLSFNLFEDRLVMLIMTKPVKK